MYHYNLLLPNIFTGQRYHMLLSHGTFESDLCASDGVELMRNLDRKLTAALYRTIMLPSLPEALHVPCINDAAIIS